MTIPAMSADDFLKSAQSLLSASQEGRDPLSELLGVEPAGKEASASSPVDDDDDTYDVPLSILARRQQLKEQSRGEESKPDSSQSKASKDKNADPPAVAVPPDKPDKPESGTRKIEQKRNVPPPAKQLKTSGSQGNSGFLADRSPLENRDEDSPFSGGPPPKRRQ